jgi:hypothetical protein
VFEDSVLKVIEPVQDLWEQRLSGAVPRDLEQALNHTLTTGEIPV